MPLFSIIETEGGLAVAEIEPELGVDQTALKLGGVVVDPGPYKSYEDACEAVVALKLEEESDEDLA